jgi:hypothetical protein
MNDAVSDTTDADSSNAAHFTIINYFKELTHFNFILMILSQNIHLNHFNNSYLPFQFSGTKIRLWRLAKPNSCLQ